jgi:hypothetical protein
LIHFNQGKEYFEAANYVAAREEFANYLSRQSDGQKNEVILAEYYQVLCSLYLNQPEIDVLGYHFNLNHPNSPQSNLLFRKIGLYFYDIANYAKSIRYLENSSLGNVEARYKLGVAYFETKDFDSKYQGVSPSDLYRMFLENITSLHSGQYQTFQTLLGDLTHEAQIKHRTVKVSPQSRHQLSFKPSSKKYVW